MIFHKVARILADILEIDEEDITSDMKLTPEFEVEKIHIAKLVIECEKKFRISIHDENVHRFQVVKDVVKYIENALAENEGNASESFEEERMWWYYT